MRSPQLRNNRSSLPRGVAAPDCLKDGGVPMMLPGVHNDWAYRLILKTCLQ
jgi:hypothetical protein